MLRGAFTRIFKIFPLFYSYISYAFLAASVIYAIYLLDRRLYYRAFWINYLINALAEFAVLVEISDHIFKPFIMIRNLGRTLTVLISVTLGLLYVLPTILGSSGRSGALSDFALRTSVTKAIILVVLFYMARHFDTQWGRYAGGLMVGFSIYIALNVAVMAMSGVLSLPLFKPVFWVMTPLASAFCVLVWTVSLWNPVPIANLQAVSVTPGNDARAVALELTRFDSALSKILRK